MKLTVEVKGEKALVRGKVWEAGKKEPEAWTIEVEDPIGNKEGAPALYANATGIDPPKIGTEIFFKNVSVIPNKAVAVPNDKETPKPRETPKPTEASRPPQVVFASPAVICPSPVMQCEGTQVQWFPRLRRR